MLRLRGGNDWAIGAEDQDGSQVPLHMDWDDEIPPLSAAIAPYRRINRTALDLAVYGNRNSELVADRIDDAFLLGQAGIDEEVIDRKVRKVLQEYEDVDFSGDIQLWWLQTAHTHPTPASLSRLAYNNFYATFA